MNLIKSIILLTVFLVSALADEATSASTSGKLTKKEQARLFMSTVHSTLKNIEASLSRIRIELGNDVGIRSTEFTEKEYETYIKYVNGRLSKNDHEEFESLLEGKVYDLQSKLQTLNDYAIESRKARFNNVAWEKPEDINSFTKSKLGVIADVSRSSLKYYIRVDKCIYQIIPPSWKITNEQHLEVLYSGPFKNGKKTVENEPEEIKNPFNSNSNHTMFQTLFHLQNGRLPHLRHEEESLFFQIKKLHKQYQCNEIVIYTDYNDTDNLIGVSEEKIKKFKDYLETNQIKVNLICIQKPRTLFKKFINCSPNIKLYQITKNFFAYYSIPLIWRHPTKGTKEIK